MIKNNFPTNDSDILRQKAKELIKMRPSKDSDHLPEAEMLKRLHELEVLHVEMELQNEELMLAVSNIESLKESEQTFKAYLENSTDVIHTVDTEGKFLFVSNVWEKYFGLPVNEAVGKEFTQFVYTEDRALCTEYVKDVLKTGKGGRSPLYRVKVANGELRWIVTNGKSYVDRHGNLLFIGISRDITERVNAEEALRKSEERFSLSMDATSDGLWDWDIQTNNIYFSPGYYRMLGYEPNEFENNIETWKNLIHPDDIESAVSSNEDCLNNISQNINFEVRMKAKDGRWRWILGRGKAVARDANGIAVRMIGTHVDITQRKEVELMLQQQREELYKLNAEKDKFFSIISHDMRGPFNGFLGFTRILDKELASLSMEQIQKIASGMNRSAENLFNLLENLLQWARIQQGLIPFVPEVIQLKRVVMQNIELINQLALSKEIVITNHIKEETLVFADPNMLKTVICNLICNAVKFTPRGGKISLSAKICDDEMLEVSINDNGIGIDKKMIDNLFRIDEKSNRKGTEGEPSSGLGLILCKDFVEKHGGKIWVESEAGNQLYGNEGGSTFYFTIPVKDAKLQIAETIACKDEVSSEVKPLN